MHAVDERLGVLRQAAQLALEASEAVLPAPAALADLAERLLQEPEAVPPLVALLDAQQHGVDVHPGPPHPGGAN